MKPISILTLFFILLFSNRSLSQMGVPVDMQSGKPIINIPIYTATSSDISIPVSLNYSAGIPETQENGSDDYNLGIGWGLYAGGSISRTVRSLPDDYQGTGTDTRMGWLYGSGAAAVNSFTIQSRTSCTGDAANYSTLSSFVSSNTDTEPDVFNFNFGGYSGQFVFDNNKIIQLLPYQDLKIQPLYSAAGLIASFTITTPNGVQYQFTPTSIVTQSITPVGNYNAELYLRDQLIKYIKPVTYTTVWSLAQMTSPTGAIITLGYGGTSGAVNLDNTSSFSLPTDIFLAGSTVATAYRQSLYATQISTEVKLLNGITTPNYKLSLNYSNVYTTRTIPGGKNGPTSYAYFLISINSFQINTTLGPLVKTINLNYASVQGRTYLQSVNEASGCLATPPYQFTYSGTVLPPATWSATVTASSILPVPSLDFYQQDYWGYYNGNGATKLVPNLYVYPSEALQERYRIDQIPNYTGTSYTVTGGANRAANPAVAASGSLSSITYPAGGTATIAYESNQYYDARAAQTFNGGGIRVKTITLHDGVSTANDIVKNYTYSGGLLLNRPQFAFSIPVYLDSLGTPHTIDQYTDLPSQTQLFMARSENDLNPYTFDGPNVIYQSATEQQTGRGYTTYQFLQPATYAQLTSPEYAAPYQWQATKLQYATTTSPATGTCMSQGSLMDGYYGFPFATNPNYNFERGLLQSVKIYNETGQLLKEKDYQYTPVYQNTSPVFIYGLTGNYFTYKPTDTITKAFTYSKYALYVGLNKLQSVEKDITYDPGSNFANSASVETDNFYTGANHLLLNNSTTSASNDGTNFTTYKVRYKYPQDFPVSGTGADAMTTALQNLQNSYIHNVVIEKISSIIKPGLAEQVTGAELHKYNTFNLNAVLMPLPAQDLSLTTNNPLSDFSESGVNSSNQFSADSRYKVMGNYLEYNKAAYTASVADVQQNLSGMHYDHTGTFPVAVIKGAQANQVVYSGFDYQYRGQPYASELSTTADNPYAFLISTLTGANKVTGRNGDAISVPANFTFSKTGVNKGSGPNYTFSCWVQSSATSGGNLLVTLTDGSGHTVSGQATYGNTNGGWVFCKLFLPVTSLNATFNISVVNSTAIYADDMLFYPSSAQVALTAFNYFNVQKASETDPHGNSYYFQYDALYRPTVTTDNNQNILKQVTYNYNISPMVSGYFYLPEKINQGTSLSVSAFTNPCEAPGITRSWNFGDNTAVVTGVTATHTYNSIGTYTITLTITYQGVSLNYTEQVQVLTPPPPPLSFGLYACGAVLYNVCNSQVVNYGYSSTGTVCGTSMPVGTNTFTAANFTACGTGTFKFEMAYDYAPNTWALVSQGSSPTATFVSHYTGSMPSSQSYTMRCTYTSNCGTGSSAVQTYHISYFAPNCNN